MSSNSKPYVKFVQSDSVKCEICKPMYFFVSKNIQEKFIWIPIYRFKQVISAFPDFEAIRDNCSNCAKDFECESQGKLHVDYEHNNEDEVACDKCGKQFSTKSGLKMYGSCHLQGISLQSV